MEIILKSDVEHLGEKNELKKVKDGYALNYLIPKGLAVVATPSAKKMLTENLRQAGHKLAKAKQEAEAQASALANLKLTLPALIGKEGKMYGSITPLQLANQLKEHGIEVDRRKILLKEEITTLGSYVATVQLYKDVKADLKFEVVEKTAE